MNSTVSDIDACTKRLEVAVPREEVAKEVSRAYKRLAGTVRIKGFRKGKVPQYILEKYYGEEVQAEAVNRVISDSYSRLLQERDMRAVGEPSITDISLDEESPELTFKATIEVIPPFDLGAYTGLALEVKRTEITDARVEQEMEALARRMAPFEEADRPAREGDYVLFDIEAYEDGAPVPGTKEESQSLLLGRPENQKELESALLGSPPGAEGEAEFAVPAGGPPALAGKTLQFRFQVREVKEPRPPELNDEFAKSLGGGLSTLEDLGGHVRREMEKYEAGAAREQGIAQLLEKLVEANPFEVPPSLVRNQSLARIQDYERQAKQEGVESPLSPAQRDKIVEDLAPESERRVRELIVIERIREKEEIQAGEEEIEAQIRNLAAAHQTDPAELRERLAKSGGLSSIISNLNYNKTVDWLYNQAKVEVRVEKESPGAAPGAAPAAGAEEKG